MITAQRRRLLLQRLRGAGWVNTRDLAEALDVSAVTVRRDLDALQAEGRLVRTHGGARLSGGDADPLDVRPGSQGGPATPPSRQTRSDAAVARAAAAFVEDGDAVLIGAGPVAAALAGLLATRRRLTVVTNSVLVAEALAGAPSDVHVVLTGGSLDGRDLALVGGAAEDSLAGLRAHRAFLSGTGVSAERGLSDSYLPLAAMHRAMAEAAEEVAVLAPARILGGDGLFATVPPERIAHLITDATLDEHAAVLFERAGSRIHPAGS